MPVGGYLVLEKCSVHLVKVGAHEYDTLNCLDKKFERVVNHVNQFVIPLLLLK